jgi:hypothetical protein
MNDALILYSTKKDLPIPDGKVNVNASWTILAYQWDIWKNVLETIEYTESWLDPKYKEYFSYYLTKNKKYFQLMAFLEEPSDDIVAWTSAEDYSDRYPFVKWKKLWILTDDNNQPIHKLSTIKSWDWNTWSWYLDLKNVWTNVFKAIISNEEIISWSWNTLAITNLKASCKRIKQVKGSSDDWTYSLDPEADWTYVEKECEMTTEGGGWEYLWDNGDSITSVTSSWNVLYINSSKDYDIKEKNWNFDCEDSEFSSIWGSNKKCYVKY